MKKIAAVDRTAPVVQIDVSDVRSRQSAGVLLSAPGWRHVCCCVGVESGESGATKTNLPGTCRVKDLNFNRRNPLAGIQRPCSRDGMVPVSF